MLVRTGLRPVRIPTDVPDGLSNTILLGEKQLNITRFGSTYDDNEPYVAPGWDSEIYRVGSTSRLPGPDSQHPSYTAADPDSASSAFGSSHPQTFNAAMGDGSVRAIRYAVNPTAFQRACVRDDGLTYNPNDL
jgi:hypothetical protein